MTLTETSRDFLAGQVLIAMPNMGDKRFERSVVLMCSHESDHAMGVIVNQRIDNVSTRELATQLEITVDDDALESPVFLGGPVQQDRGLVVHTLDYQSNQTLVVNDEIGVTGTREIFALIAGGAAETARPRRFFLALGHAGWATGQLEEEISMNAWAHGPADLDLVFAERRMDVWREALQRLGVTGAMLSPEWAQVRSDDAPLN